MKIAKNRIKPGRLSSLTYSKYTVWSFGEFSVKWTLWDAVPRQIDVNNPVFFFRACAGIFRWSFLSNEPFPQTDGNYPTLYSVHRIFPTNWRELSNAILCSPNFSHKLPGIIQRFSLFTECFPQTAGNYPTLFFVHRMFPTNWRELSNAILCSPNFSHKLPGIIQRFSLFTECFPQTAVNYPTLFFVHRMFPTNWRDIFVLVTRAVASRSESGPKIKWMRIRNRIQ